MYCSITRIRFDSVATTLAAAAHFWKWNPGQGIGTALFRGLTSFCVVTDADHVLRNVSIREEEVQRREPSFVKGIVNALYIEGIYSGILLTQRAVMAPLRILAATTVGMTGARTLVGRAEIGEGFTKDTKAGFLWGLAREALLWTLPSSYSVPFFIAADSVVYGLAEVCPNKNDPGPPKGSKPWVYKVLISAFFRAAANTAALASGISAAITQHTLFNVSRALPWR